MSDWSTPFGPRALAADDLRSLIPLSGLPHPLVAKAAECFDETGPDSPVGPIRSAPPSLPLWEIKVGQWRGGVWRDESGVHWLVIAGLAKGGHEDADDFYKQVERLQPDRVDSLKPGSEDVRLYKEEMAGRALLQWKLDLQRSLLGAMEHVHEGGRAEFDVLHPFAARLGRHENPLVATVQVDVTPVREGTPTDDIEIEFHFTDRWVGSALTWPLVTTVLTAADPPVQGWDTDGLHEYSTMNSPGHWTQRRDTLRERVAAGVLEEPRSGEHAHYARRAHISAGVIEGRAARALCGAFFVPYQDHEGLEPCPPCEAEYRDLPR